MATHSKVASVSAVVIAAMAVALVISGSSRSWAMGLVVVLCVVVSVLAASARDPWRGPRFLHPVVVMWAPVLLAGIGFLMAGSGGRADDYLTLVALESLGIAFGPLVYHHYSVRRSRRGPDRAIQRRRVRNLWVFAALCGAYYVARYGSPLRAANVEVARAAASDGYLRVLAHLCIPATICAFAVRMRYRFVLLVGSTCVVAAFGNRSPMVYLIGAVAVGELIGRGGFKGLRDLTDGWSRRKTRLVVLAGVAAVVTVVIGGAVLRVVRTPDYANYGEFQEAIANGDYLFIGFWSGAHYAEVVGDNMLLSQDLVDSGQLGPQFGSSYLSPLWTALPGQQKTLDLQIKDATGSSFIGGGIPPTLVGEGYINFGYLGIMLGGGVLAGLIVHWSRRAQDQANQLDGYVYGFVVAYSFMAQVSGFVGASTLPPIMLVVLWILLRSGVGWMPTPVVTTSVGPANSATTVEADR